MKKSTAVQRVHHRPGEGFAVDITIVSTDKNSVTGTMDLGSLPVPERRFACDSIGLRVDPLQVKLLFAQRQPVGDGLLSMLVINMAPEAVAQFLDSIPEHFVDSLSTFTKKLPKAELEVFKTNAQQTVMLNSSMIMVGYTGSNACMDFYYASPFSVQQLATLRKLSLEPVVRVNAPTGMLFDLIDQLRSGAEQYGWLKSPN